MKYERLTTKDEEGNWTIWEDDYSHPFEALQVAIERLAELEDKIENGTLIELPCKDLGAFPCEMGATVWLIYKRYWNVADKNGFWVLRESKVSPHNKKRFSDDFGKFVFLTREEAEKRLRELQGDKE